MPEYVDHAYLERCLGPIPAKVEQVVVGEDVTYQRDGAVWRCLDYR
jgi:hypothetical protein